MVKQCFNSHIIPARILEWNFAYFEFHLTDPAHRDPVTARDKQQQLLLLFLRHTRHNLPEVPALATKEEAMTLR